MSPRRAAAAVAAALAAATAGPAPAADGYAVTPECEWAFTGDVDSAWGVLVVEAAAHSTGPGVPVRTDVACTVTVGGITVVAAGTSAGNDVTAFGAGRVALTTRVTRCYDATATWLATDPPREVGAASPTECHTP